MQMRSSFLAAYVVLVVGLSVIPVGGAQPSWPGADKIIHFVLYGGLAACALWTAPARYVPVLVGSLVLGLLTEVLQIPLSYRTFDTLDLVADSLGVLCGGVIVHAWFQRYGAPEIRQPSRQRTGPER